MNFETIIITKGIASLSSGLQSKINAAFESSHTHNNLSILNNTTASFTQQDKNTLDAVALEVAELSAQVGDIGTLLDTINGEVI